MDDPLIRQFSTIEEAISWIRAREETANSQVNDYEKSISYGDYWVREWRGLFIFSHVWTKEEFVAGEMECGADENEAEYEWKSIERAYDRGYRWGRHYSEIEPDGELGSAHILGGIKLTKEQFDQAKALGWSL